MRTAEKEPDSAVQIKDLRKVFVRRTRREVVRTVALQDLDLHLHPEEFVVLIGPSGCGKSTLLKILAGLTGATSGEVHIRGRPVRGPASDRSMVFQSPGLMPWRTLAQNIELALEFGGVSKAERNSRVERYVDLVGLTEFRDHYPGELSGGMQQRVGIARALAMEPQLLLMDEPFGALDAITRERMQGELLTIWEAKRLPVLFVTHSIDEALVLADRIVVMRDGRIADEFDTPFGRPRNKDDLYRDQEAMELRDLLTWRLIKEDDRGDSD